MTEKETIVALKEELLSNSLQIEQLSEDVRGLMYAVRDLAATVEEGKVEKIKVSLKV